MRPTSKKKILITGGAGFIGHHVIEHFLASTNCDIVSLDRIDTSSNLGRLQIILEKKPEWRSRLKIVWHDLKSPLNDYVAEQIGPIDYILHLAAGSHVDRSVRNPLQFVLDNVVGTTNLLEYVRLRLPEIEVFLNFSTDEVFGPAVEGVTFAEDDRHNPCNPYSASKSAAEQICNAYCITYGIPVITSHTMNVYGIRQNNEKFIPLVIDKLRNNETVFVHTDKEGNIGARKYLHVKDVACSLLMLLEIGVPGEKYNISSDVEVDNLTLASEISNIMGIDLIYKLEYPEKTRGVNDVRYSISGNKIRDLGWSPQWTIQEGLKDVIQWYMTNK
tara:strand:+ start:1199 stop:2191 length:993 start_codon:yes stop_codon:yes gene_type:complete